MFESISACKRGNKAKLDIQSKNNSWNYILFNTYQKTKNNKYLLEWSKEQHIKTDFKQPQGLYKNEDRLQEENMYLAWILTYLTVERFKYWGNIQHGA